LGNDDNLGVIFGKKGPYRHLRLILEASYKQRRNILYIIVRLRLEFEEKRG
jgi:hypothetical protein